MLTTSKHTNAPPRPAASATINVDVLLPITARPLGSRATAYGHSVSERACVGVWAWLRRPFLPKHSAACAGLILNCQLRSIPTKANAHSHARCVRNMHSAAQAGF
jgi:hypothetical protein